MKKVSWVIDPANDGFVIGDQSLKDIARSLVGFPITHGLMVVGTIKIAVIQNGKIICTGEVEDEFLAWFNSTHQAV